MASGAVTVAACFFSYRAGLNQQQVEEARLAEQVEVLMQSEKDAAIVKRVSQQMEEIAYQQKAISDRQRQRAEEQSELALKMRDKAELESKAARDAEARAVKAYDEAERQRFLAELQQKMAIEQRDEAQHAKRVADTLNYRSLGRTLASTAMTNYESGKKEIGAMLAYAGWYFLNKYDGNTYVPELFHALETVSDNMINASMMHRGSITSIEALPHSEGCVAVSSYGEIEIWNGVENRPLFHNPDFDFRDVLVNQDEILALSLNGPLCIISVSGTVLGQYALPTGNYFKIIPDGDRGYLLMAREHFCHFDKIQNKVSNPIKLLMAPLNEAIAREDCIQLFFSKGQYAEMSYRGSVEKKNPITEEPVTHACYVPENGSLFLGLASGNIDVINKHLRKVATLNGHVSRITDLRVVGDILVSSAFDKDIFVWNLPRLLFENGTTFRQEIESSVEIKKSEQQSNTMEGEWLVPVDYSFAAWPLCLCTQTSVNNKLASDYVYVGLSNGQIQKLCISADDMAKQLKDGMKRNMTPEEWSHYIGANIPYVQFK
ncbi:MAG: hypothetical protein Q4B58_05015 [Bacteroidales bacterium]|nr:hypothetical protein [Bacteroidales bacterium]